MLKPVRELFEFLGQKVGAGLWHSLKALPLVLAQSVPAARTVVLGGFALLSLGLISFTLHVARVQEAIRSNEEYTRDTSKDLELWMARVQNVLGFAQGMLQSRANPSADLSGSLRALPVDLLLRSAEAHGLAVVAGGRVYPLRGSLDPGMPSRAWHDQRWSALGPRISNALQTQNEATVFLGLERVYREKTELGPDRPLTGSFVVARAWRDPRAGWVAVIALLPLTGVAHFLHLSEEEYQSGNYDYLVDCEGALLIHPRGHLVTGTRADGGAIPAASNEAEVGHLPLNTRDSDWIAGGDMLSKAFNAMVRGDARSVVYKNLQKENRLTSFRRVALERHGIEGCMGLVAGHGLDALDAVTTPLLLESPAALGRVLNLLVGIFVALLSGWIAFTMKIRSLQNDLLAWSGYMSAETAAALKFLPIRNAPAEPRVITDVVGVMLTVDAVDVHKSSFAEVLEELAGLAAQLKADGWIVNHWSLRSVFICRPYRDRVSPAHQWTPTAVVEYFPRMLAQDEGVVRLALPHARRSRITYAIGELRVQAHRTGAGKSAVISFAGTALTHALEFDDVAGLARNGWGSLLYLSSDADAFGFTPHGAATVVGERSFRRVALNRTGA